MLDLFQPIFTSDGSNYYVDIIIIMLISRLYVLKLIQVKTRNTVESL